jgi:hypothetical protein
MLIAGLIYLGSEVRGAEPPKPPYEHPRLFARAEDIPKLKKRFHSPQMKSVREALLRQAEAVSQGRRSNGQPNTAARQAYEAKAFLHLVNDDGNAGPHAVRMVLEYFGSLTATYDQYGLFVSRDMNRSILGAAMVYDWCYPLFAPEQRRELIAQVIRVAKNTEYGWPPRGARFVSGHYGEEKHPYMLAFGIAAYDEDPSIYDLMADHLYNSFAPVRDFFYPAHKHHQGSAYGMGRFQNEIFTTFLMTRMGAERPYIDDQGQVYHYWTYLRRPDGYFLKEGDDYAIRGGPNQYRGFLGAVIAANEYQDPYLQDEILRYYSVEDAALMMVIQDESLKPQPVESLPLTCYFGSPIGTMIARSGWEIKGGPRAGTAIAKMHVGEYMFKNHDHLHAGHFSLYYKGPLAIDSGAYAESAEGPVYGGDHFYNYFQRTIAHNCMLIHDPGEPKVHDVQNGGQFWPDRGEFRDFQEIMASGPQAQALAHDFGPNPSVPDYSYLKGDVANAYKAPGGYPPKVSEVKRAFVFLNLHDVRHPAALVVFDRVTSTNPAFEKIWLLHCEQEPDTADGVITIRRTEGRQDYHGKLINHILLPEKGNRTLAKIGGPGKEFWSGGRNWPLKNPQDIERFEAGRWRLELSPKNKAATDLFLNVMQVMDSDEPSVLAVSKIESEQTVGCTIADRVVLFSKSGGRLGGTVGFTVDASHATMNYLVTDLQVGLWTVTGPQAVREVTATNDGGCAYFRGPPGTYRLVYRGRS